ncbi:hypothetical protein GCM10007880_67140 [Mesorhizobium amorphae]|uniref:type II toxin-antitoxin system RelB/DinJ family antitoxin n=1 Tax=Mesorhizobium amorphae TaxID=71433 RepID=UPI00235C6621|nr:type II toxin-antitoxin system RelB/DinJ family antitoxin [Mesorhizobium amorphae]GLR46196.1 hypothetical protein GCM10007880_67140 [Mesorhizobium amorphae]
MAATKMVHVRVDDDTREEASAILGSFGLSLSDAVRIFLHRVVATQSFPLELKVPNATTRAALAVSSRQLPSPTTITSIQSAIATSQ